MKLDVSPILFAWRWCLKTPTGKSCCIQSLKQIPLKNLDYVGNRLPNAWSSLPLPESQKSWKFSFCRGQAALWNEIRFNEQNKKHDFCFLRPIPSFDNPESGSLGGLAIAWWLKLGFPTWTSNEGWDTHPRPKGWFARESQRCSSKAINELTFDRLWNIKAEI